MPPASPAGAFAAPPPLAASLTSGPPWHPAGARPHRVALAVLALHGLLIWAVLRVAPMSPRVAEAMPAVVVQLLNIPVVAPTPRPAAPRARQPQPVAPPAAPAVAPPRVLLPTLPQVVVAQAPRTNLAVALTVPTPAAALTAPAAPPVQAPPAAAPPAPQPPHELRDAEAQLLFPLLTEYPPLSRKRGEAGTVWLRLVVDAQGRAQDIRVERSSGYPLLDKSALTAMRAMRFRPYVHNGQPVAWTGNIPVEFVLS